MWSRPLTGLEGRGACGSGSQDTPAVVLANWGADPGGGCVEDDRLCTVALLSTSDTDLLTARSSGAEYRLGNPARLALDELPGLLAGADVVVVRLLGGEQAWREGLGWLRGQDRPVVVVGGEQAPGAALMGVAGAGPPHPPPRGGTGEPYEARQADPADPSPTVAIVYYRAHELAGNTAFVDTLAEAVSAAGGRPLPVWCASLRSADPGLLDVLRTADAMIVTVLAAGGIAAALAQAGGDEEAWDAGAVAGLDIPVLQGLCLTGPRDRWDETDAGLSPMDAATQVAIPEFDGRLISVPFSFKETGAD